MNTRAFFELKIGLSVSYITIAQGIGMLNGRPYLFIFSCFITLFAHGSDISTLWISGDPTASEENFRNALKSAKGDHALILSTQIARTYVFRQNFTEARNILDSIKNSLESAGPEAQVRYWLETGRTYASHQHSPKDQTPETRKKARLAYKTAQNLAKKANLDGLEIDATHMFVFVDTDPADQLKWNLESLDLINKSNQLEAKRWEASIRNNLGEALYDLGRYNEALPHFKRALILRKRESNWLPVLNTKWHIARILRKLGRTKEALDIQLNLEQESNKAGKPRLYVFKELEILYRSAGNHERANYYSQKIRLYGK